MLTPIRLRFSDSDREAYGCPEWLPFHIGLFTEVRLSDLRRYEAVVLSQFGVKLRDLMLGKIEKEALETLDAFAVVAWLALQLAVPGAPVWDDFDPQLWAIDKMSLVEPAVGGDVDPPASSSAETSAEIRPARTQKAPRSKRG